MKVSDDHRLVFGEGEPFNYRFEASPNFKPGLTPQQIIIYGTENRNVLSQVNAFKTGSNSAHLIIGKDGLEIVQMVSFDKAATHNLKFNKTSLAIWLDYPGYLLLNAPNHFKSIKKFDPSQILKAMPEKDTKIYPWPIYPKAQLDALLEVLQALLEKYETIHSILANDEVGPGEVDPGPAFPRTLFREKLLRGRGTLDTLEETNQEISLRAGPGAGFRLLYPDPIPAKTEVSVFGDKDGWVFIEALTELQGNPWIVGWVEERFVSAKRYIPVVRDNLLATEDGRRYPLIPAFPGNYDSKHTMEAPKYLIMHFTTGTQLSSTINTFISEQGGVSTHLVIGRDGRVIQMVPFNKSGYHVGFGFWEGERNLNRMTIGIELDNAGYLRKVNGQWLRKKTVIPPERVEEAVHWKESTKRGWEKFPQAQIDVAQEVVKALVQHYNLQDILGHDMINLINRTDPGPLLQLPMEDWREQLYGRRDPAFKPYRIVRETEIFANPGGDPPKIPHPRFGGRLPERSSVKILEIQGKWALVKVVATSKGGFNKATGWIPAANIRNNNRADKTTADVVMFKKLPGKASPPPPVLLKGGPLPLGTAVRLQEERSVWTLVFVMDPIPNVNWMEGWVMSDALRPINPG